MKKLLFILLISIVLACGTERNPLPSNHFIPGLAMPLHLDKDQSQIILTDFVPDVTIIDSVSIDGKRKQLSTEKNLLKILPSTVVNPLSELRIWSKGNYQSVLLMKSRKVDYYFSFNPGDKEYQSVQLKGEFNGWTPARTPLKLENGNWVTSIPLNPGRYQYLIVMDGKEQIDPANPDSVDNNLGGYNSVLKAGLSDEISLPFIYTSGYENEDNEVEIGWTARPDEFFVFWQNILLDSDYLEIENNELGIAIPVEANAFARSYLRVYSFNSSGVSDELLIPLEDGKGVLDPGKPL